MKIYVPEDNVFNKCYVVQNSDTIRAYDVVPANNRDYTYRDYYINGDYIYKDGTGTWSSYSTLPICLDDSIITNNEFYRNDFDKICIIFLTFLFCILILIKPIAKKFFKGGF